MMMMIIRKVDKDYPQRKPNMAVNELAPESERLTLIDSRENRKVDKKDGRAE